VLIPFALAQATVLTAENTLRIRGCDGPADIS
jgi:hypothetical protein